MSRRPAWSPRAQADLIEIARFIAEDDPAAPRTWVRKLEARALQAARLPLSGRVVPEFGRADLREVMLKTYRLVYRVQRARIVILHVSSGRRQLADDLAD